MLRNNIQVLTKQSVFSDTIICEVNDSLVDIGSIALLKEHDCSENSYLIEAATSQKPSYCVVRIELNRAPYRW